MVLGLTNHACCCLDRLTYCRSNWAKGKPMQLFLRLFHLGHVLVSGSLLCTLLATLVLPIAASAQQPENSTGKSAATDGSPQAWSLAEPRLAEGTPRWTVSIEAIGLGRSGGTDQTLVARVPGDVTFYGTAVVPGAEALNSNQFRRGFSAGPNISLTYHGNSGFGAELSYFNILNHSITQAIGPDSPADWLVMKAPGTFWQTQDFPYQAMAWKSTTSLYNAEVNGRFDFSRRVAMLAGFRWIQLNDGLQGTLTAADITAPTWKRNCNCTLSQITPGDPAGSYPPFWNTSTMNNLYGVQIGVDTKMFEWGSLSLDGTIKSGIFDNVAEQSTGVSMQKKIYPSQAMTNHTAIVIEADLELKYQVSRGLALKAGYKVLWLDGVALAPGQIRETSTTPSSVRALGVNCASGVLFQGATAGLEYSF